MQSNAFIVIVICYQLVIFLVLSQFIFKTADNYAVLTTFYLCLLQGYPIGFIYRRFVHSSQSKCVCQLFLILSGALLYMFNYGLLIYHSILAVLATVAFIQFLPAKTLLVPVSFVFHMGYLLIGNMSLYYVIQG